MHLGTFMLLESDFLVLHGFYTIANVSLLGFIFCCCWYTEMQLIFPQQPCLVLVTYL